MTDFTLSQMIEGYLLSKTAQGLGVHTIANYRHFLNKFASFVGRHSLQQHHHRPHNSFPGLAPDRLPHPSRPTSIGQDCQWQLCCLVHFLDMGQGQGFTDHHLLENIPTPKVTPPIIDPLTKEQVKALLKSLQLDPPLERPALYRHPPPHC